MIWPQVIYLILMLIGIGIEVERNGEEKKGKHNFWISIISQALIVWLLYMGGFFEPLNR